MAAEEGLMLLGVDPMESNQMDEALHAAAEANDVVGLRRLMTESGVDLDAGARLATSVHRCHSRSGY